MLRSECSECSCRCCRHGFFALSRMCYARSSEHRNTSTYGSYGQPSQLEDSGARLKDDANLSEPVRRMDVSISDCRNTDGAEVLKLPRYPEWVAPVDTDERLGIGLEHQKNNSPKEYAENENEHAAANTERGLLRRGGVRYRVSRLAISTRTTRSIQDELARTYITANQRVRDCSRENAPEPASGDKPADSKARTPSMNARRSATFKRSSIF